MVWIRKRMEKNPEQYKFFFFLLENGNKNGSSSRKMQQQTKNGMHLLSAK